MSKSEQKYVAIIGAGVSGLVTATYMVKAGIRPTIFERTSNVGGMWNDVEKPCWASMRTNLSKFTTSLSNFPWQSEAHLFPSQHEVCDYLKGYADHFLHPSDFLFNTEVTDISHTDGSNKCWTVQYSTSIQEKMSAQFDFVVVTSGFFDGTHIPRNIDFPPSLHDKIIHSSNYISSDQVRDKRVVIVGASFSAAEIAADIATSALSIVHVASQNFWSIPRFLPMDPNNPASTFLPVDFVFYRRSARASMDEILFRKSDDYRKVNKYFRLLTGGNQQSSRVCDVNDDTPPYVAISDMYAQYTKAGRIILQHGRLEHVNENGVLVLDNGTTITDWDIIVMCTGYTPCLSFFSKSILEQLCYAPDDLFSPLALHQGVFHPSLSGLAFVGMYRGPYWAVIELQARWVSDVFSGVRKIPSVTEQQLGIELEHQVRHQQPRPQFPHGDYLGLLNKLASEIGLELDKNTDIVLPAHYCAGGPDPRVIGEMNLLCEQSHLGRFVAGAVYRALHESRWRYDKIVTNRLGKSASNGQAYFHAARHQLVYTEQDTPPSSTPIAAPFPVTQRYMYSYDEERDCVMVYFASDNDTCGSLFHKLHFRPTVTVADDEPHKGWMAVGEYELDQDHCHVLYFFAFTGVCLAQFSITYYVKGPDTHYESNSVFFPA